MANGYQHGPGDQSSGLFAEFFRFRRDAGYTYELMPWRDRITDGIIDCKDGSYLTTFQVRGPDLEAATESEIGGVHWQFSNVLKRVTSPSATWYEMRRKRAIPYPATAGKNLFARLVDAERHHRFRQAGTHFDTECFLTLGYRPPSLMDHLWERFLYTYMPKRAETYVQASIDAFQAHTDRFADMLKGAVPYVTRLSDAPLQRYLKYCCTGRDQPVTPMEENLDQYLATRDLLPGTRPMLIDGADGPGHQEHLRIFTVRSFPDETIAGMLDALAKTDFELRAVARFKPLDQATAEVVLRKIQRQWLTTEVTFGSMLAQVLRGGTPRVRGSHGELWAQDTDAARQEAFTDIVRFGYWTCCVVLWHADLGEIDRRMRAVEQIIRGVGLDGKWETLNAVEAWCSTMPGHWDANPIQPIIHTLNSVQLQVVSVPWSGVTWNTFLDCPPTCYAQTHGHTPFFLDFWVHDVWNALFVGPVGSGKSTALCFALAQVRARLPKSYGRIFEVQDSAKALIYAMGGRYYDVAKMAFQPLLNVHDEEVCRWAHGWVKERIVEQDLAVTPEQHQELWRALCQLGTLPARQRTLTGLRALLQSRILREALTTYTLDGPHGHLLDADTDDLPDGEWQGFNLLGLLETPSVVPAVMTYLLHRTKQAIDGTPIVAVFDDFGRYLQYRAVLDLLDELIRLYRKDKLGVWFSTQTAADIVQTDIRHLVLDSCLVRLLFPNAAAADGLNDEVYRDALRMNSRQRRVIARARRGQVYFDSPQGNRLVDLDLDGLTQAICGATGDDDRALVDQVYAEAGPDGFLAAFAQAKGLGQVYRELWQEVIREPPSTDVAAD